MTGKEPPLVIVFKLDEVNKGLHFEVKIGTNNKLFYQLHQDKQKITINNFLSDSIFISVTPEIERGEIILMSMRVYYL